MNFGKNASYTRNSLVALDMRTFGALVAHLRDRRVLTQKELADAVGVDPNTIARTEQDKGSWYRRTSLAVFEYLGRKLPLTPEEAAEYLEGAGLSPDMARPPFVASRIDRDIAAEDSGLPVPSDQTSREMREVQRALNRLLDALGPAAAAKVMDAVADARSPSPPTHAPPPPRRVTVVEPPKVPFPGAVEQVHRTYEVQTPRSAPKPKAKPKKRTG